MAAHTRTQSEDSIFGPEHETKWVNAVNEDPEFQLASRWTDVEFEIRSGEETRTFKITGGRLDRTDRSDSDRVIVLEGTQSAWSDFLAPVPLPKNHHILAMDRHRSDFSIADGRHWFIQNLRVMDLALQLLRPSAPVKGRES
ncbi:hypothetical protein [Arthrobacter sp. ov118]|uniref:hypothetical protein n=1 Tax=Arthrobacter sp. ov118 TaxID=1761747 RepID=UPI0008E0E9DC|nr:hypothetical protein [Arthrobacter sp. ov118]SFU11721.1 hypothetical protein SAMN04487915_111162 [Arthrobacter sp. ov118]